MLRRVIRRIVRDLDEVEAWIAASGLPGTVVFDVDNTLAPQGASGADLRRLVGEAIDRFHAIPSVVEVIVLTNGPQRDVPGMISRGNKPWTTRRRLGLSRVRQGIFVVGDQVLTDGVLAWRLGATFLHLVIEDSNESASQARMRKQGRLLTRVLFREPAHEQR